MNRERHIGILKYHLKQLRKARPYCGTYQKDSEAALEEAIDALIEREGKSVGCQYCLYLEPIGVDSGGDSVIIEPDGKDSVIGGEHWGVPIKFCPMCGRKLEVEE